MALLTPSAAMRSALSIGLAVLLTAGAARAEGQVRQVGDRPWAASAFAGFLSTDSWEDVLIRPGDVDFENSYLVGAAVSRRLARFGDEVDLELEAQLVKHVGDQDHVEANIPLIVRWRAFPWDEHVDTSAAFGLGLSAASETPRVEDANLRSSAPVMAYWMLELEAGAPGSDYQGFIRLHHRSTAFGLFAEDGGSNSVVIGLRRRF
jgi:hypothetical protein